MADLTNAQKKEWAKTLYLKENLTQQEIADGWACHGVRVQLGTGREVGGTEGGAYAHKAGTGG